MVIRMFFFVLKSLFTVQRSRPVIFIYFVSFNMFKSSNFVTFTYMVHFGLDMSKILIQYLDFVKNGSKMQFWSLFLHFPYIYFLIESLGSFSFPEMNTLRKKKL